MDVLDPGLIEQISNTLSKFRLVNPNSTHLNGSLIDQVYVRKAFEMRTYYKQQAV